MVCDLSLGLWTLTLWKVNQQVVSSQARSSFFFISFFITLSYVNILPRLRPAASQSWSHTSHLPVTELDRAGEEAADRVRVLLTRECQ